MDCLKDTIYLRQRYILKRLTMRFKNEDPLKEQGMEAHNSPYIMLPGSNKMYQDVRKLIFDLPLDQGAKTTHIRTLTTP